MVGVADAALPGGEAGFIGGETKLIGDTSLIRSNTCSSEIDDGGAADQGKDSRKDSLQGDGETLAGTTNSKPSVADTDDFHWQSEELKRFWVGCFSPAYNPYLFDGLHPKALCSKICNDVLRTNININSGSSNPNDRALCFEVLNNLEQKFIQAGIVEQPTQKPGGNANQLVYTRVLHQDFDRFAAVLSGKSLEQWARERVEESIRRLSTSRKSR